jgi:O-methyltransferase involved in polyketide biosynthesis
LTATPPNSFLSLSCMWWKAMAANDVTSPVHDNGLAYDLLPSYSRWIISPYLCKLSPRLLHANIEIRTAFLDRAVTQIAAAAAISNKKKKIRLITLGGGYDTRSIKLLERGVIQEAVELDLPAVVQAKQQLLQSKRFQSRRRQRQQQEHSVSLPTCYGVDLNQVPQVRKILKELFAQDDDDDSTVTIYLFEGVFLYLNPGIPMALLQLCSSQKGNNSWLCLVDRLEGFVGDDRNQQMARQVLAKSNWELDKYSPKPGATRHMVVARAI